MSKHNLDIQHGHATRTMSRASLRALNGHGDPGKFGRMFPNLDPLVASDEALLDLARAMRDSAEDDAARDNPEIPAGYTYLGQFIDHDITLDLTPLDEQRADPLATTNFRSPACDLDSLYGAGPALAPYLYQRDPKSGKTLPKFLIGTASQSPAPNNEIIPAFPNDLPRNAVGRALIGDERNDENLLVAQTHLLFLKFHNKVCDEVKAAHPDLDDDALLAETRRIVTWHYQWIVLYDFVERLTEPGLVNRIRHDGRKFYRFKTRPYMPVEFAAAAYRLGHSMVRQAYDHNKVFNPRPGAFANGTLGLLFFFTGKSGAILGEMKDQVDPADFPGGPGPQKDLPSNWIIDWRRFFDLGQPLPPPATRNASRRLDPLIVPALHTLPGEDPDAPDAILPFRNLRRGVNLELPSAQDVGRAMGAEMLSADAIATGPDGAAAQAHGLHLKTPLWYYILKEADVMHQGLRLGPIGSTILAETFLGLIHGDHGSFLWQRTNWKPTLPSAQPGTFTMADLVTYVGDPNPIGD